ncbi:MAG: molybdopterin molybdotransferase MoeA [Ferruginibacter sp.]|nr:molybdopterin molybdotransferase MoeA [Ferruginibacter sp.]
MISVTEAKQIIEQHCTAPYPVCVPLEAAFGKILAEDIYSPIDIPAYPQSSMDGYAFNFKSYNANKNALIIIGEMAAGDNKDFRLTQGEAARIFTGAALPDGADTVVMQEKVRIENNKLLILDKTIVAGMNVRLQGAEIKQTALALEAGSLLHPAAIGFLAGIGISKLYIYSSPVVTIIVTGNELQKPGTSLQRGQVYESNSFALHAALKAAGIDIIHIFSAADDLDILSNILNDAISQSDVVLLTGGVSVGDYDFVIPAAEKCGVEKLFHKVKQRPGKPLYFGKKESKIVFGLPGNPSSVLTCFYQYVMLALQKMRNNRGGITFIKAALQTPVNKAAGLTHFLKGYFNGNTVTALSGQESFRMHSFAKANCLIEIPEAVSEVKKDELVSICLLPGY